MFLTILDGKRHNLPQRGVYVLSRRYERSATNSDGPCNDLECIAFPMEELSKAKMEFGVFSRRTDAEYFLLSRPSFYTANDPPIQSSRDSTSSSTSSPTPPHSSMHISGDKTIYMQIEKSSNFSNANTLNSEDMATRSCNCKSSATCDCALLDIISNIHDQRT